MTRLEAHLALLAEIGKVLGPDHPAFAQDLPTPIAQDLRGEFSTL